MIENSRLNDRIPLIQMSDQPADQIADVSQLSLNHNIEDVSERVSSLANLLSCLAAPIFCCICCVEVRPWYETIVTRWGRPTQVLKNSGRNSDFYSFNQCGLETHDVYMGNWTAKIDSIALNDLHGNPIQLSARYSYRVKDSLKVHFAMDSRKKFIKQQAIVALAKVAANYPYDSKRNILNLRIQSTQINNELRVVLNSLIKNIGLKAVSFQITGVGIDTNMQKLLLAKQEAQAYITSRKKTAESAFKIAKETVEALKAQNISLTYQQQNALVADLLYMICDPEGSQLDFYRIAGD